MGSGGSLTLWPPSNRAGAMRFLIDVRARPIQWATCLIMWDPAGIVRRSTTVSVSRTVIDGGILQARTELLGPVSFMGYPTSTSGLST